LKKYLILLILCSTTIFSQEKEEYLRDSLKNKSDYYIIKNDSATINLKEILLIPKIHFTSSKEIRYYYWYRKKVIKTYPFAKMASERLTTLNGRLTHIKSKRKRRKYTKRIQRYMEGVFTDSLKKMTRTEGRILIKLINRQTGKTVFNLIKEYRSGWKAFWYNATARLFKLNLKKEYHPEQIGKDFLIEDILQRAFINGKLDEQAAKIPIDYSKLNTHWKNLSIVKAIESKK